MKRLGNNAYTYRHIVYLTEQFEENPSKFDKYYQYNVSTSRFEMVDGTEKTW